MLQDGTVEFRMAWDSIADPTKARFLESAACWPLEPYYGLLMSMWSVGPMIQP